MAIVRVSMTAMVDVDIDFPDASLDVMETRVQEMPDYFSAVATNIVFDAAMLHHNKVAEKLLNGQACVAEKIERIEINPESWSYRVLDGHRI